MNHLIINREFPPFPYPSGGIGTYVDHIATLLAARGETVHVVAQRWPGAARDRESRLGGRLIVHRVPLDEPLPETGPGERAVLTAFWQSTLPVQAFMWQAARLAESLIESAAIDVVEGQEYEAPLYFLLLRRALGSGPSRQVPVLVHLHSPSEFIVEHNADDRRAVSPLEAFESYAIRAADALLCPSRFLAEIAERHYHLESGSIAVVPYPLGDTPILPRSPQVWSTGTICYIGRLEPRKGVQEWIDAAVAVAVDDPAPRFTLIGGDLSHWNGSGPSMRETLQARIPDAMRARFSFLDAIPRHQLPEHLQRARMAVVPSRWENFPNTCIEEMASGLPVLVSPRGGMVEMVEDGRTGWIAGGSDAQSLATSLRRALATPPSDLADMGAAAAASIRVVCDNQEIVRRQLDVRRRVVSRGRRPPSEIATLLPAVREHLDRPDLGACNARDRAALQYAILDHRRHDTTAPRIQSAGTMTPRDVLRASPRQQLAVVRRALKDPAYVVRWLSWHARRWF